jgi:hypothetical protein
MRHGIDAAPHYLGASLIARCTTTPEDFAASRRVEVLQARAAEYAKLADKAKTPAARARLPQPPPEPDAEDLAAHARYAGIRQQVSAHSQAFDERYHPGGKPDNEGISAFYDATEGLRHPALTALRTALDRDREERIRTTLIRTDRIVRFMVATAVSQETS